MTRTGSVATLELLVDRPRIELYVKARDGERTLALAASPEAPAVVTAVAPPSLSEAWAEPGARPPVPKGSVRTSSLAAQGTRTSSAAVPTPATDDDPTELILFSVAGAAVVIGAVIAIVVLANKRDCNAKEGFGCTEIQVQPLMRF
jgi:hypothetical protein